MKTKSLARALRHAARWAKYLALLMAALFFACVPMGDRVAGSSTEAGNAGGKLSLSDGRPAAGVSVALVAREYLPDTALSASSGDVPGAYYRGRTGDDGRFTIAGVAPGDYRVLALDGGLGATADSVTVRGEGDTALIERILKPLGGIRGVAKVVGSDAIVNVWVRSKATLRNVRLADSSGAFDLDSLPEGEYELEPICFTCLRPERPVRVRVGAGHDTILSDTLKLYPSYFQAFPAPDSFTVRPADLPFSIGGKTHRGEEDAVIPLAAAWTWDGIPVTGKSTSSLGGAGIQETQVTVDPGFFAGRASGVLRLTLDYPDTARAREWRISLDTTGTIWGLRLVRAAAVAKLTGGDHPLWRFAILEAAIPAPDELAFWGLAPAGAGEEPPQQVELAVDPKDQGVLQGTGPRDLTFLLVPDARSGGRVLRPRRDERLADFPSIRLLDTARLGFAGGLTPHMLPDGLRIDRARGTGIAQRYLVDSTGKVTETLMLHRDGDPVLGRLPRPESLLFFYRRAAPGDSFAWDAPAKRSHRAWAIDREGRAWRADSGATDGPVSLSTGAVAELESLLAPIVGDPPPVADAAPLPAGRPLAYAWYRGRGHMGDAEADSLLAALPAWLVRAGLEEKPDFALPDSVPFRYLSFRAETPGLRYTGDTLVLERDASAPGLFKEYLSTGSPGRALDSSVLSYSLRVEGDSLVGTAAVPFYSRLFGKGEKRAPLFALSGLRPVALGERFGLPIPESASDAAGRWAGDHVIGNRNLSSPSVKLTLGSSQDLGGRAAGYLYTAGGGLEREWRFAPDRSFAEGWDKR